jgi:hypothetical protein
VKTKLIRRLKRKTCPELVSGDGSPKIKAINTVFLDLRTSIEDCVAIIKAFKKLGYTTYYDAKTKVIKTTAPKTRIKKLSKIYDCIQSYNLKEIYGPEEK